MIDIYTFEQLTPYLQEILKYVALTGAGGIIGNRLDSWFVSLFYHQRKNIVDWLDDWSPKLEDLDVLSQDEKLRHIFSVILSSVSNEIFKEKLKGWGKIADSVIRNKELSFDKKRYFMSCYSRFDSLTIQYLLKLYQKPISPEDLYGKEGYPPKGNTEYEKNFIGQLNSVTCGFAVVANNGIGLSDLGKEFINFIGTEFQKI
jgi:hypothetical protein